MQNEPNASRCSGSTRTRMSIFAGKADPMSNHCIRHDVLHAETWRKVTRGRTVRRLTKRHCSSYAVLLHLTDFRSAAVMLIMHTSRTRSRQGHCCLVKLSEGFRTMMFISPTACWHSFRSMEQRAREGTSGSVYARSCATLVSRRIISSRFVIHARVMARYSSFSLRTLMA